MTNETHRYFSITDRSVYESLCEYVNTTREYPDGKGTERGLPLWDKLLTEPESPTDKLYCIERQRFNDDDEVQLQSAIDAGAIFELDYDTFMQRLHWEPPNNY